MSKKHISIQQDISNNLKFLEESALDVVQLFIDERIRQQTVEGWTLEHDDTHEDEELADAAATYALSPYVRSKTGIPAFIWPWATKWWKPKVKPFYSNSEIDLRINELSKSGALLIAEIQRLKRKKGE